MVPQGDNECNQTEIPGPFAPLVVNASVCSCSVQNKSGTQERLQGSKQVRLSAAIATRHCVEVSSS